MEKYSVIVLWVLIILIVWYWGRWRALLVIRPLYYWYLWKFSKNQSKYQQIYDEFKNLTPYLWKRGVTKAGKQDIFVVVTSYLNFMREYNKLNK